jgi:O-antigen/teichoic acid export membrane protein
MSDELLNTSPMTNALGFLALTLNLTAMTMKGILYLRILSLVANAIYIVYGLLLGAAPIIAGSSIAVVIHSVSIYKLKHRKQITL